MSIPRRQVRARYTDHTITVYQAYAPEIAMPAAATGRFVAPFKRDRMTWFKPSFLWMMYRSGWASKPGQERVLAVEILRSGFDQALTQACLSHHDRHLDPDRAAWARRVKSSPVRVQWDPERSLRLGPLPYRSLQVGLSGEAVDRYVDDWIVGIADVSALAHTVRGRIAAGDDAGAAGLLPVELPYPLRDITATAIGAAGSNA